MQALPHKRLWAIFISALVLSLLAELFIEVHAPLGFGFYAGYGFLSCAAMVLIARLLGLILKRKERYYDK